MISPQKMSFEQKQAFLQGCYYTLLETQAFMFQVIDRPNTDNILRAFFNHLILEDLVSQEDVDLWFDDRLKMILKVNPPNPKNL